MADFRKIEAKWQKKWESEKIFHVKESKKKKFYVLDMFPYPSGEGLHIGHAFVFSLGDIYARFKRMQGFNVLYPIGYDSLGLPAENAAIEAGIHPEDYTKNSIANFMKQQKAMGWSYDWSRMVKTSDSDFYKWDQWIFLQMLKKGLAYRKEAPVNFCSKCNTVLANEQVKDGKCWRHEDTDVVIKHMEQWFLKITNYAEELIEGLEKIDWPENAKKRQKNWIGRSEGTEIDFEIINPENKISNCIVVHGVPSEERRKEKGYDSTKRNWTPWIKEKLEEKGVKTFVSRMPAPWDPKYEEWKKEIEKLPINEDSVLIGHSAGAAFLVRWLGDTKRKINKLILVAPAKTHKDVGYSKPVMSFCDFIISEDIKNNVKEIIIFSSDNDSEGILKAVEVYSKELDIKPIVLSGKGHFTERDIGTKEFPELLNKIISNEKWPVFTTRPDTIYGVTFMVISVQHPRLMELITPEQKPSVLEFLKKIHSTSEKDLEELEKEGTFTGSYAINPLTGKKIPIYAGNFVLAEYGCGMVMAVPAHDQRDFEFAKKYNIPIKVVIKPETFSLNPEKMTRAYASDGILINSEKFNGFVNRDAIDEITSLLEKFGAGRKTIQYKLRDWLISRQRYWGTPIPVVYCDKCGIVPVPEKDLPVKLPEKVKFGEGNPLLTNKNFVNTKCPKCKAPAKRETDTMDTFVNSSWYFLRYTDPKNNKKIFDSKKANYWAPINQYIGGPEHITMHLIYIRFYTKFLRDLKLIKFSEPALKYFTQGIVKGSDGEKMSKSRGNVVEPKEMIEKFGADSLRLYLVSNSSPESDFNWDEKGIASSFKFVNRVYECFSNFKSGKTSPRIESKLNKTIKELTKDVEDFKHNLAVIKLRSLFDYFSGKEIDKKTAESFLKLLHIYCPFVTEELWEKLGNKPFISLQSWPTHDDKRINPEFDKQEQILENTIADIQNILKLVKGNKVFLYALPNELDFYNAEIIKERVNKEVKVFAVNDKNKYDPQEKAKKAKPGKPGVFVE